MLSLAILILFIPVSLFFLFFFGVYRFIITIILKIKHGKNFYGLLSGADTFHVVGKSSNVVTFSCLMFRCGKDTSSEEFYETCKAIILKASVLKRLQALFCRSFGYPYLVKHEWDIEKDCIGKMKTLECSQKRIDKQQLYTLLNYYCNAPMPKNGKAPFHMLIGTQPVSWKNDDWNYYPVMFRVHHAVADGVSLLRMMVALTTDKLEASKEPLNSFKHEKGSLFVNKQFKRFIDGLERIKMLFLIICLHPSLLVTYFTYKAKDTNILYNTSLARQTLLGVYSEKSTEYVEKIKRIREKLPGTAFPTILIAAFSASLSDYFKKNCVQPPQYITIAIPINVNAAKLRYLRSEDVTIKDLDLSNSYSLVLVRVPIAIGNEVKSEFPVNNQVVSRLRLLNKEFDIIKHSFEYPLVLTDIIPWVPHMHHIGTSLGIMTYDGRLHVGVNVDKALISDQNDVQDITDDIFKYLKILEKEVEAFCNGDLNLSIK
ncbi:hypothetical protein ILUMI_13631 [Ignelater luminosus]|uniref:O-acyltransferase WSD1 C-terminal domain-containing protein n=1 Tax=Ignelater luminosus TaxID=2038154 RepID=A0A8K0G8H0_IGNLU|nr:hypothetical protein ILUMI_13631 [Ignelater luminosus]